jgi:hypothetical protein
MLSRPMPMHLMPQRTVCGMRVSWSVAGSGCLSAPFGASHATLAGPIRLLCIAKETERCHPSCHPDRMHLNLSSTEPLTFGMTMRGGRSWELA